jgi:hypothetical protein
MRGKGQDKLNRFAGPMMRLGFQEKRLLKIQAA